MLIIIQLINVVNYICLQYVRDKVDLHSQRWLNSLDKKTKKNNLFAVEILNEIHIWKQIKSCMVSGKVQYISNMVLKFHSSTHSGLFLEFYIFPSAASLCLFHSIILFNHVRSKRAFSTSLTHYRPHIIPGGKSTQPCGEQKGCQWLASKNSPDE